MKIRRRSFRQSSEAQNFWPSFTDMISTIALILFFLMLLAYIQNIITGNNLEYAKQQLMDTEKKLETSNMEIKHAENNLRLLEDRLEDIKAEVKQGEIALQISEQKVEEQKDIIAASNRELGNLRAELRSIAVLRLDVLKKVKESIEDELGKTDDTGKPLVTIGENGNIRLSNSIVFDPDSTTIKTEGKKVLNELAKSFEAVLNDKNVRKYIDAIEIQGHTDKRPYLEPNRKLSTDRATAVVDYLMKSNPTLANRYGEYFAATGYSEYRPVASGNTEEAWAQNRRIEIAVILKDPNIQNLIDNYLKDSLDVFEQ
jgi:chemotaxis protein MotB